MSMELQKRILALRMERKYKRLNKKAKQVVDFMLQELQERLKKNSIPLNKLFRNQRKFHMFELTFSKYKGLHILAYYKSGAARVKCFSDCIGDYIPKIIEAVEEIFSDILECEVELEPEVSYRPDRKLNVYLNIREDGTL